VTQSSSIRPVSAAQWTPVGRGAVATIRVDGDLRQLDGSFEQLFHAANGRSLSQQPIGRIVFGKWVGGGSDGEDLVICKIDPESLEIHCHGGEAAVRRILNDLNQTGCPTVDWASQLRRSGGTLAAECAEVLSRTTTFRTSQIVLEQSGGLLRRQFEQLLQEADNSRDSTAVLRQVNELLDWSEFGQHLVQPWSVVLTGRPNVGKSSLINALLGYRRAIVFDQPGTTRDVVTAETAFDGWPVMLSDTAGLRDTDEELEAAGIAQARQRLEGAHARLLLVDLSTPPSQADAALIDNWPDAIVIGHKCDLGDCWQQQLPQTAIRASSVTGQGLDEIQRRLIAHLIPRVPPEGTPIPLTFRQSDLLQQIRDQLIAGYKKEACRILEQLIDGVELQINIKP